MCALRAIGCSKVLGSDIVVGDRAGCGGGSGGDCAVCDRSIDIGGGWGATAAFGGANSSTIETNFPTGRSVGKLGQRSRD